MKTQLTYPFDNVFKIVMPEQLTIVFRKKKTVTLYRSLIQLSAFVTILIIKKQQKELFRTIFFILL